MGEIIKKQDKRREFIDTLLYLREHDERVFLIVPDVGFLYIEQFIEKYPQSFLNTGVTEQSTTILAATMAISGFKVFLYSMIPFVLFRPAEQVRNAIVFHNASVVLLGVKGGESYRFLGRGHNLLHDKEDFNFCDNIGLKWSNPQTNEDVRKEIIASYLNRGPRYIRL